jgi:hypothetical protein
MDFFIDGLMLLVYQELGLLVDIVWCINSDGY